MKSNVRAVTPKPEDKPQSVDREKTCPLLLRVFTSKGKFCFQNDRLFYLRLKIYFGLQNRYSWTPLIKNFILGLLEIFLLIERSLMVIYEEYPLRFEFPEIFSRDWFPINGIQLYTPFKITPRISLIFKNVWNNRINHKRFFYYKSRIVFKRSNLWAARFTSISRNSSACIPKNWTKIFKFSFTPSSHLKLIRPYWFDIFDVVV